MIVKQYDEVDFKAVSSLSSLGLFSIGVSLFLISNHRINSSVDLFLILLFVSLLVRFSLVYIVSKNISRALFAGIVPSIWFCLFCYFILSDKLNISLDNKFLNFAMGPFFVLIGVLRVIESFGTLGTVVAPYRLLILTLALVNFFVGFCLLLDWPSSQLWDIYVLLGIDLIITSFTIYLFSINFVKIDKYFSSQ
jgi:hypothetical protein